MSIYDGKKIEIDPHNPIDVANVVSTFVNNFSHNPTELAKALHNDHRTLVQSMTGVFIKFFELLAQDYERGYYDARNEASCKLAAKIFKNTTECDRAFPFI